MLENRLKYINRPILDSPRENIVIYLHYGATTRVHGLCHEQIIILTHTIIVDAIIAIVFFLFQSQMALQDDYVENGTYILRKTGVIDADKLKFLTLSIKMDFSHE